MRLKISEKTKKKVKDISIRLIRAFALTIFSYFFWYLLQLIHKLIELYLSYVNS